MNTPIQRAFKVALGMIIAYSLSLAWGWEKPYWAGLAIAFLSLPTSGDSTNRAILRFGGTLFAAVICVFLANLVEYRWLFFVAIATHVAICQWMMFDHSRWYFWAVAGFTVPLLLMGSDLNSQDIFANLLLRLQETLLGVTVYSVINILIFPVRSAKPFFDNIQQSLTLLSYPKLTETQSEDLTRLIALHATNLDSAEVDNLHIYRHRNLWREIITELVYLAQVKLKKTKELSLSEFEQQRQHLHHLSEILFYKGLFKSPSRINKIAPQAKKNWQYALRQMLKLQTSLWIAICAYIYLPALPDATFIIMLVTGLGIMNSINPLFKPIALLKPCWVGWLVAAVTYLGVLPHCTEAWQMLLTFGSGAFFLAWFFSKPAELLNCFVSLLIFVLGCQIEITQQYDVISTLDLGVMIMVVTAIIWVGFNLIPDATNRTPEQTSKT